MLISIAGDLTYYEKGNQSQKYGKAYIKGDSSVVNNYTYISCRRIYIQGSSVTKKTKSGIYFGGPHSVFSFPHTLTYSRIVYDTIDTHISMPRQFILKMQQLGNKVVNLGLCERRHLDVSTEDQICGWDRNGKLTKVHHRKVSIEVICNWSYPEPQEYLRYKRNSFPIPPHTLCLLYIYFLLL